jgi:hypothetical protein
MNGLNSKQILNCSIQEIEQLKALASSTTAGIWRIKRAKALLGVLQGISPEKLMYQVRVPVASIVQCIDNFVRIRMAYFDKPDRSPTKRESAVEKMLAMLDNPPSVPSDTAEHFSLRYIGIQFTENQIRMIREMISNEPKPYRSIIARQVCSTFNLYGENGKPRFSVVIDILKRMAMDNLICIPVMKSGKRTLSASSPKKVIVQQEIENRSYSQSLSFYVVLVQKPEENALWNSMIYHYHYIPTCRLFGQQLRYLIFQKTNGSLLEHSDLGIPIAALSFSSPSWRVSCRDNYIGWNDAQRVLNLPLVINNSRFLILPWIKIQNLASSILGTIGRRVGQDWETLYHRRPVLMESFVERDRFSGTCYRAANWVEVGTTVGYSLHGWEMRKRQATKSVFLRPLQKNFRDILSQNHKWFPPAFSR